VEHCVSEEVTGIDLVREQFRIANGEPLGYSDPTPRAHSIEFRINGEDAGRNFLPAPGTVAVFQPPSGPGVRLDSGVVEGDTIAGAFDSMLAKLIVTGHDRKQAIQRARRALAEFVVDGMPTVLPFHRAVLDDEAFDPADAGEPFTVHTRWIETEWDNTVEPFAGPAAEAEEQGERQTVVVEVGGKRLEVVLPGGLNLGGGGGAAAKKKAPKRSGGSKAGAAASGDSLTAPMQGTIVKIAVEEGQQVAEGELVVVLEAMKMEQPINAHKAGTITGLSAEVGQTVTNGAVIADIKD
jgi:acetyl-CoA/propionyl-CoA carboxylase biotin carboxyl carrier protein